MTESEWLAATDPTPMLEFVRRKASSRKARLFSVACCRQVWDALPTHSRLAVEAAERFADGDISRAELSQAEKAVGADCVAAGYWDGSMGCGSFAAKWGAWNAAPLAALNARMAHRTEAWVRATTARRWTRKLGEAAQAAHDEKVRVIAAAQAELLRDLLFPFRRHRRNGLSSTAAAIGEGIYRERAYYRLPILADTLQEAGCDDEAILAHCRSEGPHIRGCWVIDLVTGRS